MGPAAKVTLCLLCGCAGAWGQPEKAPPDALVSGTVVDRVTGAPVLKAVVTLSTEEETPLDAQTMTDGAGRFGFASVPPGRYQLHADCNGYLQAWYGAETANHPPGIIILRAGDTRDFTLPLDALGAVSGVVVDTDGDPLPGVTVSLWMQSFWRGKAKFFERYSADSDDRGAYRIPSVVAGGYIAMANGLGQPAFRMQPEAIAGQKAPEPVRFGVQFYPGTDRMSAAARIAVGPGKEVKGTDFHMAPSMTATLGGAVIPPVDVPADSRIDVVITQQDLPDENQSTHSFSLPGPNYSFEQYGLAPGEYLLLTRLSLGERRYQGVQRVEISGGTEKEVTLKLEPGVDLAGSLRVEGDGVQRGYTVELSPGDAFSPSELRLTATVNAGGSFVIKSVVPGIWDIGVFPIPPGGYIRSMRLGDQDVLTEDMIIGPRTGLRLQIVISARGGVLEGTVKRDSGKEAARAILLLAPTGKFGNVLSFYSTAVADESGRFKLKGLTPGSYRLYAFESMEYGAWQNPEFLKPFSDYGENVEISEGANKPSEVKLIPGARNRP
jgi:Carboxypeptidase regulatory-like domain